MATYDFAPGHLSRWIAVVGRGYSAPLHAVLMSGTELYDDPLLGPDRLQRVERRDVMCAIVLGPIASTEWSNEITRQISRAVSYGSPLVWCLERLMDSHSGVGTPPARPAQRGRARWSAASATGNGVAPA